MSAFRRLAALLIAGLPFQASAAVIRLPSAPVPALTVTAAAVSAAPSLGAPLFAAPVLAAPAPAFAAPELASVLIPSPAAAAAPALAARPLAAVSAPGAGPGQASVLFDGVKGERLAADLEALRMTPVGTRVELPYVPTKGSLRALGKLSGFEAMLSRRRGGNWVLIRGDAGSVPDARGDYDIQLHNHYYHPVTEKTYTPYPSDGDLVFSSGQDSRFLVASESGIVEWSPRIPLHPAKRAALSAEQRAALLDTGAHDGRKWRRDFRRGSAVRAVWEWFLPAFYSRLLRASGVDFTFYRWSSRLLTQAFIERVLDAPAPVPSALSKAPRSAPSTGDPLIGPLAVSSPRVADRLGEALALARTTKIGRRVLARAEEVLSRGRPLPVSQGGAKNDHGAYDYMKRRLLLNRSVVSGDPRELAATIVHELRHVVQHADGVPAEALEMEIEAHFDSLEVLRELGVEPTGFAAAFAAKAAEGREALYAWMQGQMPGKLVLRGANFEDLQEALETELEEQELKNTPISRRRVAAAERDLYLIRSSQGRRAIRALIARVNARLSLN